MPDFTDDLALPAVTAALREFGTDLAKSEINSFDLTSESICRSIAKVAVSAVRGYENQQALDVTKAFLAETEEEFDTALRNAQTFLEAWREVGHA